MFVNHTILRIFDSDDKNSRILITTPKTDNSIRKIPLNHFLLKCLFSVKGNDSDYILTNSKKYIEPRNYYSRYKTIMKQLNMSEYNYHTLRHTFATRCMEIGIDIKSLSELLGHANIKTTLSIYVHPNFSLKRKYLEKLLTTQENLS